MIVLPQDADRLAKKQVAVCFAKYRNLPHIARARVAWANGMLRLWLDLEHSHVWQPCLQTAVEDSRMADIPRSDPTTPAHGTSPPYADV